MIAHIEKNPMLIWISYDLGIDGDYEGIYEWLDSHDARECGDSLAVLSYKYKSDLIVDLNKDLRRNIKLRSKDRIYIVYSKDGNTAGKFLYGRRKFSPWKGYANLSKQEEDAI